LRTGLQVNLDTRNDGKCGVILLAPRNRVAAIEKSTNKSLNPKLLSPGLC
jgi:hypothetical protein